MGLVEMCAVQSGHPWLIKKDPNWMLPTKMSSCCVALGNSKECPYAALVTTGDGRNKKNETKSDGNASPGTVCISCFYRYAR